MTNQNGCSKITRSSVVRSFAASAQRIYSKYTLAFLRFTTAIFLLYGSTFAQADENWLGYDAIVEELSQRTTVKAPLAFENEVPDILLHAGIGLASSYVGLDQGQVGAQGGFGRGFEVNFGIDLFSSKWLAEGSVRTYQFDRIDQTSELRLTEFDLKLVHTDLLTQSVRYRIGGGLSARYLDFTANAASAFANRQSNTPASIFLIGFSTNIVPGFTLGSDLSYRQALVSETVETSSIALGLRVDTHF